MGNNHVIPFPCTSSLVLFVTFPTFLLYNTRFLLGTPLLDKVWGTNSLFVESSPGRGDYHPLELRYGQVRQGIAPPHPACRLLTADGDGQR